MPQAKKTDGKQSLEKKTSKKQKQVEQVSDVVEDVEVEVEVDTEQESKTRVRKVVDKESIMNSFDELIQSVENEIESLRENGNAKNGRVNGVKFLRTANKKLKTLRSQSNRLMKTRKKTTDRSNGQNSGFLKEVPISKELYEFTGWQPDTLASRVQVTKFICNYIKENNLQNPSDRREINPDKKLAKLLDIKTNSKTPLKYYSIQTHLKPHFPSNC